MLSIDAICQTIETVLCDVTGVTGLNPNDSLIDRNSPVIPVNFLYIFALLEKELALPVYKIFETHSYEVMTINGLAEAFFQMQNLDA